MWLLRYKRMKAEAQGKDRTDTHTLRHTCTHKWYVGKQQRENIQKINSRDLASEYLVSVCYG